MLKIKQISFYGKIFKNIENQ